MYTYQADNQTVGAGKAVICEKQSPPEFQQLLQPVNLQSLLLFVQPFSCNQQMTQKTLFWSGVAQ